MTDMPAPATPAPAARYVCAGCGTTAYPFIVTAGTVRCVRCHRAQAGAGGERVRELACKACRFWDAVHRCDKVGTIVPTVGGYLNPDLGTDKACMLVADDHAEFVTAPDFGCALWEPREPRKP